MIYLLDTNTCIRFLDGRSAALLKKFQTVPTEDIAVCSVVKGELFYGAKKSSKVAANLASQQTFLSKFVSLPFDDQAADIYSDIRAQLEKAGTIIGPNDLLIAAITLAHSLILVTHNTKEFNRVPALRLEDWEL
jgi:tRNA(fMet)-specific endonuclease VapC